MNEDHDARAIALVRALCEIWEAPDYSAEAMVPFFTEDCAVRLMHTLPFARGHAQLIEQARMLMPSAEARMRVRHLSTQLAGPLVIAHRIDTLVAPGQPEADWEMLGVFLIENGKVREWTDYMLTPFAMAPDGTVVPAS